MAWADFVRFTLASLGAHRLRTFLTALGIAVGIAAVILLTSIGEGIHRFVLGEFTREEREVIDRVIPQVADAIEMIVTDGLTAAMNKFNRMDLTKPSTK